MVQNPNPRRDGETAKQYRDRQAAEHRGNVARLEDEALLGGRQQDPDDRGDDAAYLREVAEDITQRRAGNN